MAGVETHPEPCVAAGRVQQRGQLGEGAPERAAGAGRVLERQRAVRGAGQRLADHLARPGDRLADVAGLRRAGMKHDTSRPDPLPDAE